MSLKSWLQGGADKPKKPTDSSDESTANTPPPSDLLPPVTLADITRGMQFAATAANQLIAHQYMQALEPFFEAQDDGRLAPRTVSMQLDDKHDIDLPLIALATPRGLMLNEMKVNLTVRTDAVEQQEIVPGENLDSISRFHVSLSPNSNEKNGRDSQHVDIEMQFSVLEPPESVMRLIDEYTNRVLPKANREG